MLLNRATHKWIVLFLLLSNSIAFTRPCLAQPPEYIVKLPYEISFKINDIKTKMILLDLYGDDEGMFGDFIFGFQDPQTEKWIFFDAEKVGISNKTGLQAPFELKLLNDFEIIDTSSIQQILKHQTNRSFLWKCKCEESIPKLPI